MKSQSEPQITPISADHVIARQRGNLNCELAAVLRPPALAPFSPFTRVTLPPVRRSRHLRTRGLARSPTTDY